MNAYKKKNKSLIAIASWEDKTVRCKLEIDWESIGIDKENAVLRAPKIEGFQGNAKFSPSDEIAIEPGKGWLLILENRS